MSAVPRPRRPRLRRSRAVLHAVRTRQRSVEVWMERRAPALYDARHAAQGIGRAAWPVLGPVLAALIVGLLAALARLLDLHAPSVSVNLPSVPLPSIHVDLPSVRVPGWLRSFGRALGEVLDVVGVVAKWVFIAGALVLGIRRTRDVRRRREAAEVLGRDVLMERLATTLAALEVRAREHEAEHLGELARRP